MLRIDALRLYERELFHAVRNGLSLLNAHEQSITRTKEQFLKEEQASEAANLDRTYRWHDVLDILVEWGIVLQELSPALDLSRLPSKPAVIFDRKETTSTEAAKSPQPG